MPHDSEPTPPDLSPLLKGWAYNEENKIRWFRGADGEAKLQVRLPLGIEQYEVNGRPDGLRPHGCESWLEYYEAQARSEGPDFRLGREDFKRLHSEGLLYYYRYLLFFQIGEYKLCRRDTDRNLRLLDFVEAWSGNRNDWEALGQYRPYIVRMNTVARAMLRVQSNDSSGALRALRQGIEAIHAIPRIDIPVFKLEKARALTALQELVNELEAQRPPSRMEHLERQLREAIEQEDYERAAALRDEIRKLGE